VLNNSLELLITYSVHYVEEIFSINLLSFWDFVRKIHRKLLSFLKFVIEVLDAYFLKISNIDRLEFRKLEKVLLTCKY